MASRFVRALRPLAGIGLAGFAFAACATGDPIQTGNPTGGSGSGGGGPDGDAICLLSNCSDDSHCGACSEGRTTCLIAEGRCVACNGGSATGCPEGQVCSSWGNCVPEGLECDTNAQGVPQITCSTNADCAACDPLHQVCDGGACVACSAGNTAACQSTDACVDGECAPKCPSNCDADADCSDCGGPNSPAHACNAHKCAECSPTFPCGSGLSCSPQGVCVQLCGTDGEGRCEVDEDCDGCAKGGYVCHTPINGGAGTCGPAAAGCSDLGEGVVLPPPYDQVTNLCSDDGDCDGVGVTFNVGEVLRDLTGFDDIGDANVEYPMNACADITVASTSCGVCVPCREDADCQPIDIDQVAADAFGPLGSIAAAFLLDQVFGDNDHNVHMYCQTIAAGYGACVPCPGVVYECGVTGGGGGGSGSCDHDPCDAGGPLDPSCGACEAELCDADPYCCNTDWDDLCVDQVASVCGASTCSGSGPVCHDECVEGDPLDPTCSACADAICTEDSYCCDTDWDDICVGYVAEFCSPPCD